MPKTSRKKRIPSDAVRGRVRAHDPFELIRWLALSQPDPRKALAELVQNSLDAGARRIRVTRLRERKLLCLKVWDDGEGVIPEMDRAEALRFVATHIGHSRKRSLSPQERMELMTQGQYGIGLLGFWSLGQVLELRSSVVGQRPHRLTLHRDRPDYLIEPIRGRLALDETWTEIVVHDLHREASSVLGGRRAADYLASELRGQLLARDVELGIEDRISRGRALKKTVVRPLRFLGEKLEGIGPVPVEGHPPIRLELYISGDSGENAERSGIGVYASGTLVADSFRELAALGLDRAPWDDPRLTGLIDFPGLHVAPGSRRGIIIDATAGAFAAALSSVEPLIVSLLEKLDQRRSEQLDRSLLRDLQRAFRDFYRHRPRYAMLPVQEEKDLGAGPDQGAAEAEGSPAGTGTAPPASESDTTSQALDASTGATDPPVQPELDPETVELFPPGPLAAVRIIPPRIRMLCGASRRLRAEALDAAGRRIELPVAFAWEATGPIGLLDVAVDGGDQAILTAATEPGSGSVSVTAHSGTMSAVAEVEVEIVDEIAGGRSAEGIPEPDFVDLPGVAWRSRMQEGRWQVNSGHRDYRAIVDRPSLKLRYLAMLFAKEVVLRSHSDPRLERPLEQMAEVMAFADQKLAGRGRTRKAKEREKK